jgi:hypothetical protein
LGHEKRKATSRFSNTHAASSVCIAEFVSEAYLELRNKRENEGFETG